jgi:hypothetical protein
LATCDTRFGGMAQARDRDMTRVKAQDALNAIMHADYESVMEKRRKQAELDAPKLVAEDKAAFRRYGECVFASARLIALNSSEPAEVVAKAAFASCREDREAIFSVHRRYHDSFSEEAMERVEHEITGNLLLEIIKARVPRSPAKPPAKPDTPI